MARRDDIAGIAALAGLGMLMANRGGGNKPSPYDTEDMRTAEDTGPEEDPMEAANRRTERTLMPNERGAAGTSETVFPSQRTKPTTRAVNKPSYQGAGGSGGGRGPTAEELAAYRNQGSSRYPDVRGSAADSLAAENRRKIREGSEGIEGVYPEQMLGGPGLKTAQAIAKSLAARTAGKEAAAASPYLKELSYSGTKQLPNAPTKQITGPSKAELMARDRAARASSRNEEMLRENARRYGLDPDNMSPAAAQAIRRGLGGDEFSLPLKKGGMTKRYAMGGSVKSSASSRGDGIATKGKTRGKIC